MRRLIAALIVAVLATPAFAGGAKKNDLPQFVRAAVEELQKIWPQGQFGEGHVKAITEKEIAEYGIAPDEWMGPNMVGFSRRGQFPVFINKGSKEYGDLEMAYMDPAARLGAIVVLASDILHEACHGVQLPAAQGGRSILEDEEQCYGFQVKYLQDMMRQRALGSFVGEYLNRCVTQLDEARRKRAMVASASK